LKKKITTIIPKANWAIFISRKKIQLDQRLRDGGSFEEKVTNNQRLGGLIHLKKNLQPDHKLGMGVTWKKNITMRPNAKGKGGVGTSKAHKRKRVIEHKKIEINFV